MDNDKQEQSDTISVMLDEAGIPVPAAEIGKIARMHRNATSSRQALRALRLMETEPATILAPDETETDGTSE